MKNEQTQLEKASDALAKLVPNITTSDRKAAKEVYAESTVVQYLKGEGKNLDTAIAMLQFFRKRIENRDKQIA